ncbi:hypothetical protein FJY69_07735 [candidate division WOR-3 bacterium]|nr:hypothetical protein [candidate division WOR-3 bacterium]
MDDPSVPSRPRHGRPLLRPVLLLAVYALAASFALSEFIRFPGLNSVPAEHFGPGFFGDMVYGRAPRPYVTRVLVPLLVRAVVTLTPAEAAQTEADAIRQRLVRDGKPEWLDRYPFEFGVARVVLFLFLLGFAFALRELARQTLGWNGVQLDIVPVVALFALPGTYGYMSHLCDFPTLCLFTLGLLFIAQHRFWPFFLVFLVATVNKETSVLLTLVWAIDAVRRQGARHALPRAALQIGAWLAIRGLLALVFLNHAGPLLFFYLARNLGVFGRGPNYFLFRTIGNWLVVPVGLNFIYLAAFFWALAELKKMPRLLKDAFWIVLPMAVLALLFGNVDELRIYYEFYPVILLVLLAGTSTLLGYTPTRPGAHGTESHSSPA